MKTSIRYIDGNLKAIEFRQATGGSVFSVSLYDKLDSLEGVELFFVDARIAIEIYNTFLRLGGDLEDLTTFGDRRFVEEYQR